MSENPAINVFLCVCSIEQDSIRNEMAQVLQRAGMNVIPANGIYDPSTFSSIEKEIGKTNCAVHIIFPEHGPLTPGGATVAATQFEIAKKKLSADPEFKLFVWVPPTTRADNTEAKQSAFINEIRNSIVKNMVFSNAGSAIQLADDIRSQMEVKIIESYPVKDTDIFLISNQLDESEANSIIDLLSDIVPVEKLNIIQDSDTDYSELCKQQIAKSKLAVVYFKMSADWAIPFTQQVWKKIGGATTHTPILLIGDDDPDTNLNKKFNAPKVISLIVAGEIIPLEIKVQYDKVVPVT